MSKLSVGILGRSAGSADVDVGVDLRRTVDPIEAGLAAAAIATGTPADGHARHSECSDGRDGRSSPDHDANDTQLSQSMVCSDSIVSASVGVLSSR